MPREIILSCSKRLNVESSTHRASKGTIKSGAMVVELDK